MTPKDTEKSVFGFGTFPANVCMLKYEMRIMLMTLQFS